LELTTNFVCGVGRPFIVTETSWKRPNLFQSEGPFLISAYQSLSGVDAVCWFVATEPTWNVDPRRLFWPVGDSYALEKWTCSTPMQLGMFPAAALSYRRGDVDEGPVIAHERRTLGSIFDRERAALDDNEIYGVSREIEELKSPVRPDGRPSRAMFLIGRVTSDIADGDTDRAESADLSVNDIGRYLDAEKSVVRSATAQMEWNYEKGVVLVDSPRTQGVTGFLHSAGGIFNLSKVVIDSSNEYASVSVVSLDNEPLEKSRRVLVQVGTSERLSGWKTKPATIEFNGQAIEGERIVNAGHPPLRIANARVRVTINNAQLSECVALDTAGYPKKTIAIAPSPGQVTVDFPADALYVVLRSGGNN
jgi:hypothetical protein